MDCQRRILPMGRSNGCNPVQVSQCFPPAPLHPRNEHLFITSLIQSRMRLRSRWGLRPTRRRVSLFIQIHGSAMVHYSFGRLGNASDRICLLFNFPPVDPKIEAQGPSHRANARHCETIWLDGRRMGSSSGAGGNLVGGKRATKG